MDYSLGRTDALPLTGRTNYHPSTVIINYLASVFTHRTRESIKNQRRNPEYKAIVESLMSEGRGGSTVTAPVPILAGPVAEEAPPASSTVGSDDLSPEPIIGGERPAVPHGEGPTTDGQSAHEDLPSNTVTLGSRDESSEQRVERPRIPIHAEVTESSEQLKRKAICHFVADLIGREPSRTGAAAHLLGPINACAVQPDPDWDALRSVVLEWRFANESGQRVTAGRTGGGNRTRGRRVHPRAADPQSTRPRDIRRAEYKRVQAAYGRNPGEAAQMVLSSNWQGQDQRLVEVSEVFSFWGELFGCESLRDQRPVQAMRDTQWSLLDPIRVLEVVNTRKATGKSASGPDGLEWSELMEIPPELLTVAFNLWMVTGAEPAFLSEGRTTLIPKVRNPASPRDYRPITISSHVSRLFHRILAARISSQCAIDPVQKAFQKGIDGCNENLAILEALIGKTKFVGNTHIAFLDMAKAFDTVSHDSILRAMRRAGFPQLLSDMVMRGYEGATTVLSLGPSRSAVIPVKRGVKQGDPLSPVLFNLVLDECIEHAKRTPVGMTLDGLKVPVMAFADDLVLTAESRIGLQTITDGLTDQLRASGLEVNRLKCMTLSLIHNHKKKTWAVDQNPFLKLGDGLCSALNVEQSYTYLGIKVGGEGKLPSYGHTLERGLANIRRAPLKPQQRLNLLVKHLVPQLQHRLVLGPVFKGQLARLDRSIRVACRKWCKLPKDTPDAFLYAPVSAGGLQVPCLSTLIPLLKQRRMERLAGSSDPVVRAAARACACKRNQRLWSNPVWVNRTQVKTNREALVQQQARLYSTVDGAGLKPAVECPKLNKWLSDESDWVSGGDYIKALQVRANSLPTPARLARGRTNPAGEQPLTCSARCSARPTLAHISQVCAKTHGMRVKRHDDVVSYVARGLRGKGHTVMVEPVVPYGASFLKPDLVVLRAGGGADILDVQIVADSFSMNGAHESKVRKYSNDAFREAVRLVCGRTVTHVGSITLNWRGIWYNGSAKHLLGLGLSRRHLAVPSLKATTWTHSMFSVWSRTGG